MQNQDFTIPGIVFIILLLVLVLGTKLSPLYSVVIGFVGFGITYFLLKRGG